VTVTQFPLTPQLWLLEVQGRLDQSQTPQLETILDQTQAEQHFNIIVDFSQATYINSGGLRCLLTGCKRARNMGGDIVLCCLKTRIAEIFYLVGLDQVFSIYATRKEAIDHFDSQEASTSRSSE
jgi:anti-sigma B factor antagonist